MVDGYALEIGLALLAGLSLALAAVLTVRRRRGTCRWRRVPARDRPALRGWVCRRCGEEAYSQDRKPPRECKRALRNVI